MIKGQSSKRQATAARKTKQLGPRVIRVNENLQRTPMNRNIFGDKSSSNHTSIPAAFVNILGNGTYVSAPAPMFHEREGLEGIRIHGCQPLTNISTAAASSNLFVADSLATIADNNTIYLSPDRLNGPLAGQANFYMRYVIRDILVEYLSNVATTQPGSVAMCISPDPNLTGVVSDFSTARVVSPSVTAPFRAEKAYLHYHYSGDELYFQTYDSTSLASKRQTIQATLMGFPSISSLGLISQGFTNVYYVVELYAPVATQGVTVLSVKLSKEERLAIESYIKKLRQDANKIVEEQLDAGWSTVVVPPRNQVKY